MDVDAKMDAITVVIQDMAMAVVMVVDDINVPQAVVEVELEEEDAASIHLDQQAGAISTRDTMTMPNGKVYLQTSVHKY